MSKIEYYMVKPNLKQIYGRKVTKDLNFDEYTKDRKVHQVLRDCVLTTHIKEKNEVTLNGFKEKIVTEETSKVVQTLPVGTILIWSEEMGYIVPTYQMTTLDEHKKEIEMVEEIYKGGQNDGKRTKN